MEYGSLQGGVGGPLVQYGSPLGEVRPHGCTLGGVYNGHHCDGGAQWGASPKSEGQRRAVRGHTRWRVGSQPQPLLLYSAVEPGGGRGRQPSNRHRQPSAARSPWSRPAEGQAEPHPCQPPCQPKAPAPRRGRGKALSPGSMRSYHPSPAVMPPPAPYRQPSNCQLRCHFRQSG